MAVAIEMTVRLRASMACGSRDGDGHQCENNELR